VIRCDALVVGGGPGGSTCARVLQRAGWHVVLADRARFPRDKVCAGWLTPHVFRALDLDPAEYQAEGLTLQEITAFRTGLLGRDLIETRYSGVVSYGIRRCEFDDFLLRRARVHVLHGTPVVSIQRSSGTWVVNEAVETPVLVGAGGHFCPVARHISPNSLLPQPVVAKEAEFRLPHAARVSEAPELFFCADLEGYAWCVQKGEYLNVGIGRRHSREFLKHVNEFAAFVGAVHHLPDVAAQRWRGHAYLASGAGVRRLVADGVLLVGDAAGLAYPESGEGIRPAVESGRLAAETLIASGGRSRIDDLQPYADALTRRYPPSAPTSGLRRTASRAAGRLLLTSRAFTRHVVLDRWFLRS
jgi:geranylgeranyl reductase family protein